MSDGPSRLPAGVQVAPSILAADFARLGSQVQDVLDAGARVIHVDVMDGHFVPPITIGPTVVGSIAEQVHSAGGVLDVHLMIERPERQLEAFAEAGADNITVHAEATPNLHHTVMKVYECGCSAGVAVNPATPTDQLSNVAGLLELALCMTVNPGWGGQQFIEQSPAKIKHLCELLPDSAAVEVDGGIDQKTAPLCTNSGATLLVAGSAIFDSADPAAAYRKIVDSVG